LLPKMWDVRIIKTPKRQEKCRNSACSFYWRSVEDQNCILLQACSSTFVVGKLWASAQLWAV